MNCVVGYKNWLKAYSSSNNRRRVWIYIKTSCNKQIWLFDYDDWKEFQDHVDKNELIIQEIGLQWRSQIVKQDASNSDGVYVVKAVKGEMYGETLNCYVLGVLREGKVEKTMYLSPSLVEDIKSVDDIEECFKEVIVYHGKKRKAKTV